ncbi:50S ribosomal protein L18 [Ktedonobacter sp. SOSP1-52]|uniref:50S ribosomal protein L18 n=1 Tax=Ktedonobacter sp. SOSP1-52 TaxID=2778366 RepID=UPI0035B0E7EE
MGEQRTWIFCSQTMIKQFHANQARLRRHQRIRRHLEGSELRPRLNVFRSGQHIYAQIIDDTTGKTLVSASTLDESLRDFKPVAEQHKQAAKTESAPVAVEEVVEEAAPAKGKKAAKGGRAAAVAEAPKKEKKSQTEKLAGILSNRKVSLAHEVGKLVAQRAQEKGVKQVVFDRGGYAYHGRVAALAEGAREAGLDF